MQDRFKFRVWLPFEKRMITTDNGSFFALNQHGSLLKINDKNEAFFARIGHTFSKENIMQCTGLKDKYGKLIYEGDILELYVSTKKAYRYQVKYEIGSFMLVSNDEIFDFRNKWNDNVYPLSQLYFEYENEEDCIYQCEVIGNVWKNPELLEAK